MAGFSDLGQGGHFNGGDYGVTVYSNRAALYLSPDISGSPYTLGVGYSRGDVIAQTTGDLWHCVAPGTGNTTARFRKLSGPATAGSAHILTTPVRFVDSATARAASRSLFQCGSALYDFDALQPGTIPARARGIFQQSFGRRSREMAATR